MTDIDWVLLYWIYIQYKTFEVAGIFDLAKFQSKEVTT